MKIQCFCMAKYKIVCTNGKKVLRSCRVNNRQKPIISHFWQNISRMSSIFCEKAIKKYKTRQEARPNASANISAEDEKPKISRG